jgi:hypothetical protein
MGSKKRARKKSQTLAAIEASLQIAQEHAQILGRIRLDAENDHDHETSKSRYLFGGQGQVR